MAARFYAISRDEIHEFLTNLGFQSLTLKGVVELVYGKIVRVGNHRLSLRIYSAVNPNGESREKGTDAIRVQVFHKVKNEEKQDITPVGRSQKCFGSSRGGRTSARPLSGTPTPTTFGCALRVDTRWWCGRTGQPAKSSGAVRCSESLAARGSRLLSPFGAGHRFCPRPSRSPPGSETTYNPAK